MGMTLIEGRAVVVKEEPKTGAFGDYTRTSVKIEPPHPKYGAWLSFNKPAAHHEIEQGGYFKFMCEVKDNGKGGYWVNVEGAEAAEGLTPPPAPPRVEPPRPVADEPLPELPRPSAEAWLDKDAQIARQVIVKCLSEMAKMPSAIDTMAKAVGVDMALTHRERMAALCTAMETYIRTGCWA